jgi:hypothetical protein
LAWPEDQWATAEPGDPPAWQVSVHVLMGLEYWLQPQEAHYKAPDFNKEVNVNLGEASKEILSREDLTVYSKAVRRAVDAYFSELTDDALTKPSKAYPEWTNLDVIIENIRHMQHHLGQLNARLKRTGHLPTEWFYFKPN